MVRFAYTDRAYRPCFPDKRGKHPAECRGKDPTPVPSGPDPLECQVTPDKARTMYLKAVRKVAPDADLAAVRAGADVRYVCQLDPQRFRLLVDRLSDLAGFEVHYDDADADSLRTVDDAVRFLVNESSRITLLGLHHAG